MTADQTLVFGTLAVTLTMLVVSIWRYDIVALLALLFLTVTGVIPAESAFSGFAHPAVITVAAVLVISRAFLASGAVDTVVRIARRAGRHTTTQVAALAGAGAILSAFINNVGALALLMPASLRLAHDHGRSPSVLLMPIAFATLLGGMTTLIGTPPNLIIAEFRGAEAGQAFRVFDFALVGVPLAVVGVGFIAAFGWRLVPRRDASQALATLPIEGYVLEFVIPEGSHLAGQTLHQVRGLIEPLGAIDLVRGDKRRANPAPQTRLRAGDILLSRSDPAGMSAILNGRDLAFSRRVSEDRDQEPGTERETELVEVVVSSVSPLVGRSARSIDLAGVHGARLLGVARRGSRLRLRPEAIGLRAGDVLLLSSTTAAVRKTVEVLRLLPLAQRDLPSGEARTAARAGLIFAGAVVISALGILPAQVALVGAAVMMVVTRVIGVTRAYEAVEWPVIVLLGAMIPVGNALESTGGAELMAKGVVGLSSELPVAVALTVVLVGTMILSDVVNNAAAAVVAGPVAISVASGLDVPPDAFLMAVAIGASSAFLTPIGHQSNTLVMGPGGYRFGDYWRLGLPVEILLVATAVPLLILFWGP